LFFLPNHIQDRHPFSLSRSFTMAIPRTPDYRWVYDLLSRAGEKTVSQGFDYSVSRKVPRKPTAPSKKKASLRPSKRRPPRPRARKFKIIEVSRHVKGTRIPVSTLKRLYFATHISENTLRKLRNFNRSYTYRLLRQEGADTTTAISYSRRPVPHQIIEDKARDYRRWVDDIARAKGIPREYVLMGMRRSTRTDSTWERYVRALGNFSQPELQQNLHKQIVDRPERLAKLTHLRGKARKKFLRQYSPILSRKKKRKKK